VEPEPERAIMKPPLNGNYSVPMTMLSQDFAVLNRLWDMSVPKLLAYYTEKIAEDRGRMFAAVDQARLRDYVEPL
jgi:hypothetical protein